MLSLGLPSSQMVDDGTHLTRLGFWLRLARERSGKSQEGAAKELGLSAASKSSVSDWENGVREPSLKQLRALARYYKVPIEIFIDPPVTGFEQLDRLVELAAAATTAEQQDWEAGEEAGQGAGDGPSEPPRTRSA